MRVTRSAAVLLVIVALLATAGSAQERWRRGWGRFGVRMAATHRFDGAFNFCRVMYSSGRYRDGGGWATDYPAADVNLSIRLSELTKTAVSRDAAGEPNHLVVRLTDEALFKCPFVLMSEVGSAHFDEQEVDRLRTYLLKGGFLWVDDFWGSRAWSTWVGEISKVLPPHEYPIVDLESGHPLFRTLFELGGMPQIPSINYWYGSGGDTSERGPDSAEVHARAIADGHGRLMVLMTHNTDIADSWEREGDDPNYFLQFSPDGYAVAINVLLYTMTH